MYLHVSYISVPPAELTCEQLACDMNARCVTDPRTGEPRCECGSGYRGDGTFCEASRLGEWLLHGRACACWQPCILQPCREFLLLLHSYANDIVVCILTNSRVCHWEGSICFNSSFQPLPEEQAMCSLSISLALLCSPQLK